MDYATHMITFQKTFFENAFNAVTMVQDQTEKITNDFLTRLPWVTEEGKKAVTNVIEFYKKARTDFKKVVDDGFEKTEELFAHK
jgi:polyhydroxyalkanoate synthesis regulator phasin